jgi:hypothetical protein
MWVAYSRWYCGDAPSALATVRSIEAFLRTQMPRMAAIIDNPELKESVQRRPHVRFDAQALTEVGGDWAHAQNDALAYAMWMRLRLTDTEALDSAECELWELLARYFGAIEYWSDLDSGAWEESRKINASSVGAVLAALLFLLHPLSARERLSITGETQSALAWSTSSDFRLQTSSYPEASSSSLSPTPSVVGVCSVVRFGRASQRQMGGTGTEAAQPPLAYK